MKNNEPYNLPDGYFDSMQSKVESQVSLPDTGINPYKVPANYWKKMQTKVLGEVGKKAKIRPLWSRHWVGAAACFLLVICGVFWLGPKNNAQDFAIELPEQDLLEVVGDDDLTLDQLAELVTLEDILEIESQSDDHLFDIYDDLNIYELQEMF